MKLFNLDSPLMRALNKMADLMWLNILTLICCIPIVTVGASMTAMHYMALKIARDEECYITRDYFKSFRLNFRQATVIWLIMLFFILVLAGDFFIMKNMEVKFSNVINIMLLVVIIILLFTSTFVFPVLAKFDNTILRTIKNAFFIGVLQFPKTILMMILSLVPPVLFIFAPRIIPIVVLFCFSAPAWVSAKLYNKFFQKLEDQINGENAPEETEGGAEEEDERIFKDELDEALLEDSKNQ
ncbi:MAG: DUF624 domain-containing protein [Lachnospiraceae bacterium]|nr:DUF624 domain-containing protein [Lachnospiraceae bacterium]